jgi:hypothetical protein
MVGAYPPGSVVRLADGQTVVVAPGGETGLRGVVVGNGDASGRFLSFEASDVVAQLLPSEAGVSPGAALEAAEHEAAFRR